MEVLPTLVPVPPPLPPTQGDEAEPSAFAALLNGLVAESGPSSAAEELEPATAAEKDAATAPVVVEAAWLAGDVARPIVPAARVETTPSPAASDVAGTSESVALGPHRIDHGQPDEAFGLAEPQAAPACAQADRGPMVTAAHPVTSEHGPAATSLAAAPQMGDATAGEGVPPPDPVRDDVLQVMTRPAVVDPAGAGAVPAATLAPPGGELPADAAHQAPRDARVVAPPPAAPPALSGAAVPAPPGASSGKAVDADLPAKTQPNTLPADTNDTLPAAGAPATLAASPPGSRARPVRQGNVDAEQRIAPALPTAAPAADENPARTVLPQPADPTAAEPFPAATAPESERAAPRRPEAAATEASAAPAQARVNVAPDGAAMILQPAPTAAAPAAAAQVAGHATAPAVPAARQVAPFAVSLALGSDSSTSLVLEPAELGRVEVAIERNGSEAHVTFRADRPETLALLQRDRAELERALSNAGFGSGSDGRGPNLSFGLGGEGAGGHERRQARGTARSGRPQQIATIAAQPLRPRSLIDLAI